MMGNSAHVAGILAAAPIAAVLFDVDGTLYSQRRLRQRMLPRLLRHVLGNPVAGMRTLRVVREYRRALESLRESAGPVAGIGLAQLGMAAERSGVSLAETGRIVAEWFDAEPLKVLRSCIWKGLAEFLVLLESRAVPMGIVSDYEAADKLTVLGIARYFGTVVTPKTTGRLKPHPAALDQAMDGLSVGRERVLYVGDRMDIDGTAARRAGIRCAILGGAGGGPLTDAGHVIPFRSYGELQELILPHLESAHGRTS